MISLEQKNFLAGKLEYTLVIDTIDGRRLRFNYGSHEEVINGLERELRNNAHQISITTAEEGRRIIEAERNQRRPDMAKPQQNPQQVKPSNPPYTTVAIQASANGWTVAGQVGKYRDGDFVPAEHTYTFDDFDKMSTWLKANVPNLDA